MPIKQSVRILSSVVVSLITMTGLLAAVAPPAQAIAAENIITRAQSWVDAHVTYSQSNYYTNQYGTYRTDCSGFVSMAWGLGQSLTTVTLPSVSHIIAKEDLQPGDVLLNTAPGNNGHVIIFAGWSNAAHTAYNGYESSPVYSGAHFTSNVAYPYWAGNGTFTPYRYNNYENTPADRDHDGVPDASDRCPDQPGSAATGGCPDTDGDAVANLDDKCPQMPGRPELLGCSEEDINPMPGPVADFNGDGRADYCRRVGAVNLQTSYLSCTLSTGDGFGKTITSPVLDWGFDTGRAWIDFNGDGRADYCRRVGAENHVQSRISCTLSTGDGFGKTITSPVLDWGFDTGRAWVDFNADGKADYCRRVGAVNLQTSYLSCTLSTGDAFGKTVQSPVLDWGFDTGRAWIDFNSDSKADYCRRVGAVNLQTSYLSCTLSTGDGFGKTITSPVLDWGFDTGRAWIGASLRYPRAQEGVNPPPSATPGDSSQASKKLHKPRRITVKRIDRNHVVVRWKRVARATGYRIRLAKPKTLRTAWRKVNRPRATLRVPRGQHPVVTVRAVGVTGLGPAVNRRL